MCRGRVSKPVAAETSAPVAGPSGSNNNSNRNNDREDDGGCSGSSEVGLVVVGDLAGEGDLFLGKEVERKRVGRLLGVGACLEERRKGKQNMSESWKAKGKVKERVGGMEVEMRKGGQGAHLLL